MTTATAFLLILWIGSHLAIVLTIRDSKFRLPVFAIIGFSLLVAYAMKPYTYDLKGYSIFFNTGYLDTHGWHSPGDKFKLDLKDITGEPFTQGFEPGFRFIARTGHFLLPRGSLIPRFDPDAGDFEVRDPTRSDAIVYLIMVCGFIPLYIGAKRFIHSKGNSQNSGFLRIITSGPLIFGSVFFLLGSQNSLRQFLGVSIIILALSMWASRRYAACLVLVLLSTTFHKWSPILGLIGVTVMVLGRLNIRNCSKLPILRFPIDWASSLLNLVKRGVIEKISLQCDAVGRFVPLPVKETCRLSSGEMLSLAFSITTVALIKGIAILGIFTADIPLIGDLKPYLIMADQYESMERLSSFVKAGALIVVFTCSEILLGRKSISDSEGIRSLRRMIFIFVIPLVIFPEIFSRMVILYWAIELIFVVWALSSSEVRARLSAATVFVAYGFAPNAINVLIGPYWIYSF
jgi:hypothetical protein